MKRPASASCRPSSVKPGVRLVFPAMKHLNAAASLGVVLESFLQTAGHWTDIGISGQRQRGHHRGTVQ